MSTSLATLPNGAVCRLLAMLLAALASGTCAAEGAAVYKCVQDDGVVLYTDFPCKGGEVLEIYPGVADPAAGQRLAYARAELERGAALRKANEAALREEILRRRVDAEASWGPANAPDSYPEMGDGLVWGNSGVFLQHRARGPGLAKHAGHRRSEGAPSPGPRRNPAERARANQRPLRG